MDKHNSLEIVTTKLVQKVQSLAKKPSLDTDIRKILDQLIENVEQQSIYLENGIYNFNFAEVAIVLEQVTIIYTKKVDLLWECLLNYQKGLLKFNTEEAKTREEEKIIEERRQKFKRKRRKPPEQKIEEHDQESKLDMVALLQELYEDYDEDKKLSLKRSFWENFSPFPIDPEKEPRDRYTKELFVPTSCEITSSDVECTFDNYDLMSNYYNFNVYDIIRQAKYNSLLEDNVEAYGYDVQDDFIQEYIIEKKVNLSDLKTDKEIDELEEYIYLKVWEKMPLHQRHAKLCPRRSSIMLTRLSDEVVAEYLKRDRRSMSTNLSHDSGISDMDFSINHSELAFGEGTSANHSGIFEENSEEVQPIETVVPNVEIEEEDNDAGGNREGVYNNVVRNDGDGSNQIENTEEAILQIQNIDSDYNLSSCPIPIEEQTKLDNTNDENKPIPKKRRILNSTIEKTTKLKQEWKNNKRVKDIKDIEYEAPEKKRSRRTSIFKLSKTITKPLSDFEIFFYENYKTQIGEGRIKITNFLRAAYLQQSTMILQKHRLTVSLMRFELFFYKNYNPENLEGTLIEPILSDDPIEDISDVHSEEHDHPDINDLNPVVNLNDSGFITDFSDVSNPPHENTIINDTNAESDTATESNPLNIREILNSQVTASNIPDDDQVFEIFREQQERSVKFFAWKSEIDDKLSKTEKKDFNIHEYESKILDQLPHKEPVPLKRVLGADQASEVARLFAASLQLVNNSNIKLRNVIPGKLVDDTVEILLLSKDKHHVQLENYQAPSMEKRIEALKRIRAQQRCKPSTSGGEASSSYSTPYKKMKIN
ncbi:hypothetical protein Trydic_g6642 [Trypoxylus dichotomus]